MTAVIRNIAFDLPALALSASRGFTDLNAEPGLRRSFDPVQSNCLCRAANMARWAPGESCISRVWSVKFNLNGNGSLTFNQKQKLKTVWVKAKVLFFFLFPIPSLVNHSAREERIMRSVQFHSPCNLRQNKQVPRLLARNDFFLEWLSGKSLCPQLINMSPDLNVLCVCSSAHSQTREEDDPFHWILEHWLVQKQQRGMRERQRGKRKKRPRWRNHRKFFWIVVVHQI